MRRLGSLRGSVCAGVIGLSSLLSGCVGGGAVPEGEKARYYWNLQRQVEESFGRSSIEREIDTSIYKLSENLGESLRPFYVNPICKNPNSPEFTPEDQKKRMGFIELSDIDGKTVRALDHYVTEKLLTYCFASPEFSERFKFIERYQLSKILKELRLESNSLFDPETAKRFGKLKGIDAFVTGTVTVGNPHGASSDGATRNPGYVDMNVRVINTETGSVVGVAAKKIRRSVVLNGWLERNLKKIQSGW